ncbi:MAG: LysR family transcriptional regulator [Cycloclasticus sp.]
MAAGKFSISAYFPCNNARMNDWDDIRYFLAVARNGNVTSAAKALDVNHSTVSRRIRALEEKHGVRLFERIHSGYEMTDAGSDIFDLALELELRNSQISRQLFGLDNRLQGKINLTMPHDILEFCLIDEIAEFRKKQPDILLNLSVAQGLKNMAAREADVAIRLTNAPPDYLIGKKITSLQHGIYAQKSAKLSGEVPIVVWNGEDELPLWAKTHFPDAKIVLQINDLFSMYCAVKAGIGIARMPCYLPDAYANKEVGRLDLSMPSSDWGVWVLSHVDLKNTARIRYCREFLIDKLTCKKALFEGEESTYLDG